MFVLNICINICKKYFYIFAFHPIMGYVEKKNIYLNKIYIFFVFAFLKIMVYVE